jgi:hypothetical protein
MVLLFAEDAAHYPAKSLFLVPAVPYAYLLYVGILYHE